MNNMVTPAGVKRLPDLNANLFPLDRWYVAGFSWELKGKPLAENDPVLRSVEAYILSTRKGAAIEPGKH